LFHNVGGESLDELRQVLEELRSTVVALWNWLGTSGLMVVCQSR